MPEYPIAWKSYQSDSKAWSQQRLLNMYPIIGNEGTKSKVLLSATPGKRLVAQVGSGPIRGMFVFQDLVYVVSGAEAYKVNELGNATLLGVIGGSGPVTMDSNELTS